MRLKNTFQTRTLSENNSFRFYFWFLYYKNSSIALLLHGNKGTADFGELRHRNPMLSCGLVT